MQRLVTAYQPAHLLILHQHVATGPHVRARRVWAILCHVIQPERPIRTAAALADLFRDQIASRTLPPGARMPSERELMQAHGLGRDAVRRAIDILEHEGIVVVQQGQYSEVANFGDKQEIVLDPGCRVEARMPSPKERDELGVPLGWPVLHVIYPDGSGDLFPAHRYCVRVAETEPGS